MSEEDLGGRLELLDPAELSAEQQALYERLSGTMIRWAGESGFASTTEAGRLIGPFNPILLSPGISAAFLDLQAAEQANSSLSARVREVVILSVGAVWRGEYELYAHEAVAKKAGLPQDVIEALARGQVPDGLDEKENLAARVARALTVAGHRIDPALYRQAEAAFGRRGLVDIVMLTGAYHIVCGLLNAFEIPAPDGRERAAPREPRAAGLATVAAFPVNSFLENLAVRSDNSVLVTSMNARELFYVPPAPDGIPVEPVLLHRFEQPTTGLVEIEPDVFLVSSSNLYTTHESFLHRLDLTDWRPGSPAVPEMVFRFPDRARGLNGSCLLAPGVVLVADCFAGLIWRLDVQDRGRRMSARVWLEHDSMGYFPGTEKPEQPGVNGVRYARRSRFLYYTATAKKLLMRVPVDPATWDPSGGPELVVAGRTGDDFCIDEDAEVLYLGTHRQNTIDRISLDPSRNTGFAQCVAGDPFTEALIGPSSGAWGRGPGETGVVAFFITDGGTASPASCGRLPAKLLRVTL